MIAFLLLFLFAFTFQQAEAEQNEEQHAQFIGRIFRGIKNAVKHVVKKTHHVVKHVAKKAHKAVGHVIKKLPLPNPLKNVALGVHNGIGKAVSTVHKHTLKVVKHVHGGVKTVVKGAIGIATKIPVVGPLIQKLLEKLKGDREDPPVPPPPEPEPPVVRIDPKILAFQKFLTELPGCPPSLLQRVLQIIEGSADDVTRRTAIIYLLAQGLTVIDFHKIAPIEKKLRVYPHGNQNGIGFPQVFDAKVDKSPVLKALHAVKQRILKDFIYTTFHDKERGHFHKNSRKFAIAQLPPHLLLEPLDWKDDTFTTLTFFDGIGAPTLQVLETDANANPDAQVQFYVADFDATIGQVQAEDGFEQLGGRIFFETAIVPGEKEGEFILQKTISQIQFRGESFVKAETSPKRWEFLKLVMRTNAFLLTSVKDHLLYAHLKWSQFGTKAIREVFQNHPQHPLYKMLHMHTHKVEISNSNTFDAMVPKNGILHRLFAAKFESLQAGMKLMSDGFQYQTWVEEIERQGLNENVSQYVQGGKILYVLFSNYVNRMLQIMYPDEVAFSEDKQALQLFRRFSDYWNIEREFNFPNFQEIITEFIWRVTFYHTHVGRASVYAQDAKGVATRLEACWDKPDDELILRNNLVGHFWNVISTGFNSMLSTSFMDERNSQFLDNQFKLPYLELLSQLDEINKAFPQWGLPTYPTSTA